MKIDFYENRWKRAGTVRVIKRFVFYLNRALKNKNIPIISTLLRDKLDLMKAVAIHRSVGDRSYCTQYVSALSFNVCCNKLSYLDAAVHNLERTCLISGIHFKDEIKLHI